MNITFKKNKLSGYVLLVVLMALAIITLGAGYYLKNASNTHSLSEAYSQKALQNLEVLGEAERVRKNFQSHLDKFLVPNETDPTTAPTGDVVGAFSAWVANYVTAYNTDAEHQKRGERLELNCLKQEYSDGVNAAVREECTKHRGRDPKLFRMRLSRVDPNAGVFNSTTQEFQVERSRINQYAYLLTNVHPLPGATDGQTIVRFGQLTFHEPIGVFFASGVPAPQIRFGAKTLPGTVFEKTLVTNLNNEAQLVIEEGSKVSLPKVAFNQSNTFVSGEIATAYQKLKTATTTINAVDVNGRTPLQRFMLADCIRLYSPVAGVSSCEVQSVWSAYYVGTTSNECGIQLAEVASWVYYGTTIFDSRLSTDPTIPNIPSPGSPIAPGSTIVYDGIQSSGAVYYLPSNLSYPEVEISSLNNPLYSKLCESQTLLADGFMISNSIIKPPGDPNRAKKNSALFTDGSIRISSGETALPTPILNTTGAEDEVIWVNAGTPTSLAAVKAGPNLANSNISFKLQVSLIPGGSSDIVIPNVYFDENIIGVVPSPRALGTLALEGLMVSGNQILSTKNWNEFGAKVPAGFVNVKMSQGFGLTEYPPPGLAFGFNVGLTVVVTSVSNSETPIEAALADVQGP